MQIVRSATSLALLCAALAGCDGGPITDSDAGTTPGHDAGSYDGGAIVLMDSGPSGQTDAGPIATIDSGTAPDAATPCTPCEYDACDGTAILRCYLDEARGCTYVIREECPTGLTCNDEVFFSVYCVDNCGNGTLDAGEACDDGDTSDDDGCSSDCEIEAGWTCEGAPSSCEFVACAGAMPLAFTTIETDLITAPRLTTDCGGTDWPTRTYVITAPTSGQVRVTANAPDESSGFYYFDLCTHRAETCAYGDRISERNAYALTPTSTTFGVVAGVPYYVVITGSPTGSPTGRITLTAEML